MNSLKMHIHNMKCIKDLDIELPLESGLYAITGLNGSGKSTIVACAACAFFNLKKDEYFGTTSEDAMITLQCGSNHLSWKKDSKGNWIKDTNCRYVGTNGFYEGSLMFGNRFRDTSFNKIIALEHVPVKKLKKADDFIREALGEILQGDKDYYEKLYFLENNELFSGTIYYYEKEDRRVSQFHMSTGECLLLGILTSIYLKMQDRASIESPYLMLLDEIEMALHPLSLHRLLSFLDEIARSYNIAIYFSTHSLELIGRISADRIFYINRFQNGKSSVTNPCSSAYATRSLYTLDGYDSIICVEDILAKTIIERIITKEQLRSGKLVYVSPIGGYTNVLDYTHDTIKYKSCGVRTSICCVLDGDVVEQAKSYIQKQKYGDIPVNYLPIESLEKYLYKKLVVEVDDKLFSLLSDYVFQQTSLERILSNYQLKYKGVEDDNGKLLWGMLEKEMDRIDVRKEILVEHIWCFLERNESDRISKISNFLHKQLEELI